MSSAYERELKAILSGDPETIARMSKSYPPDQAEGYQAILRKPFMVTRAAGSFGVDLVAIRGDVSFPVEVKASRSGTMRSSESSGRATEQARDMLEECKRSRVVPIYALRKKGVRGGDPWRVFTLEGAVVEGNMGLVYRRLPFVRTTAGGHFVMDWDEGMPLHRFLDYLCG